jgi:hypothetical protein
VGGRIRIIDGVFLVWALWLQVIFICNCVSFMHLGIIFIAGCIDNDVNLWTPWTSFLRCSFSCLQRLMLLWFVFIVTFSRWKKMLKVVVAFKGIIPRQAILYNLCSIILKIYILWRCRIFCLAWYRREPLGLWIRLMCLSRFFVSTRLTANPLTVLDSAVERLGLHDPAERVIWTALYLLKCIWLHHNLGPTSSLANRFSFQWVTGGGWSARNRIASSTHNMALTEH